MSTQWYAKEPIEIIKELDSHESGLASKSIENRLKKYGINALPEAKQLGILSIFFSQFSSPLIYILLAAAGIVLVIGEIADAVIIFIVLLFNAIMGTIQEGKAQRTLLALKQFVETSASVLRDGKIFVVPDKEIVPGDIVVLQEGDKVPADARIISSNNLKVNESSLTGESAPISKISNALDNVVLPVHDQKNMVFKGTNIVSGNGTAIAVSTGVMSEIGKISQAIVSVDTDVPLKRNIKNLSRLIIATVFVISAVIMIVGLLSGRSLLEMFSTVVSLSVSIIPEGLPIVMTLVLATGVWRMTKKNVLVKRLQAVEALGQAKIIAVDKTGTLTKNEMVLKQVYINKQLFDVESNGYEPTGNILFEGKPINPLNHPDITLSGKIASFCSNAHAIYMEKTDSWKVSGDPTEAALGVFSQKVGFTGIEQGIKKIFELPFDYTTKFHLTIHTFENKNFMSVIGAPEKILALADRVWREKKSEHLSLEEKVELEEVFSRMSKQGFRVLAFAMNPDAPAVVSNNELPSLTFCGFFALKDPIREEAIIAIQDAHKAGIRVVMITGDHKITARAIADEAGLIGHSTSVITGEELEKLSDDELLERFAECNVFARVTPNHKLRIIELFRKRGEVVAMTGDGVNDAPSLAAADLGVAMGKVGTEVAKEASDIILLDDNFGNIITAVEEGRNIYKTIKRVILYLFSTSVGEALVILVSMLLGFPLPILPAQIIWLNFITDGFLDISLVMEPKEANLLTKKYNKPSRFILDAFSVRRMMYMGIIIAIGTIFVFSQYLETGIEKALTMSLTTLAVFQWFNAWNCKYENKSLFSKNPFNNMYLVYATIAVITFHIFAVYNPFMQRYLHTVPLNGSDWMFAIVVSLSILVLEEVRKLFSRIISKKLDSVYTKKFA